MSPREEVQIEVEAALLNSGCSAREAVRAAMEAVARFAVGSENPMTRAEFDAMWAEAQFE